LKRFYILFRRKKIHFHFLPRRGALDSCPPPQKKEEEEEEKKKKRRKKK
jgi:diadenosine tetraphosphate (Ap4A) HIT family hydrolase